MSKSAGDARKSRHGWTDVGDTLLPVAQQRLQAAITARHVSIKELSKQCSIPRATLAAVIQGKQKCRLRRVERLADELHVPLGWLLGNAPLLEFQLAVTEERSAIMPRPEDDRAQWAIIEERFVRRCYRAFLRDLEDEARDQRDFERKIATFSGRFILAVYGLINPESWRRAFLREWDGGPLSSWHAWHMAVEDDEIGTAEEAEDAITSKIITAMESTLAPWFDGRVTLDYKRVISRANVEKG